jgi:hypothetical protein
LRFFTNQDALAQLIADVYAGKLHPRSLPVWRL